MIRAIRRIYPLILVFLVFGCGPVPSVYHEQIPVFGTLVEVKLYGVEEAEARELVGRLAGEFETLHHTWHAWEPGPLGRINAMLPGGEFFPLDAGMLPLIHRARELSLLSGGLFNPAIGRLIALWGFASDEPAQGPPPAAEAITALLAGTPRMSDLQFDGVRMRSLNPAVKLDFGAFAKGYAVDRAIEHLRAAGVQNAIVNAGGDLRAIGRHGERPWRIGIRHPRGGGVLASVDVAGDESLFTSGDYERYFDWQGVRYDHILDPRTGYPARGLASVTVFASQADLADAAATALAVAGPGSWLSVARSMGVSGVILVADDGTVTLTPGIQERIQFAADQAPAIVVSEPLAVTKGIAS